MHMDCQRVCNKTRVKSSLPCSENVYSLIQSVIHFLITAVPTHINSPYGVSIRLHQQPSGRARSSLMDISPDSSGQSLEHLFNALSPLVWTNHKKQ